MLSVMKELNASVFKAQCLSLLDGLSPEGLTITKRGKPIAKVMPISSDCSGLIGMLKGTVTIHGDIFSTGEKWNAES